MIEEFELGSAEELVETVTARCINVLADGLTLRGRSSVAVSGGSSPAPVYRALANTTLDWSQVHTVLVDERWVPPDHSASNDAFVHRTLLTGHAAQAAYTPLITDHDTAAEALADREAALAMLPQPFDLVLLGMGSDGHTASWFPHAVGLDKALDRQTSTRLAAISATRSEVTGEHTERITLTLSAVLDSRQLVLMFSGAEKLATYQRARAGSDVSEMPVRALWQQDVCPLSVYYCP